MKNSNTPAKLSIVKTAVSFLQNNTVCDNFYGKSGSVKPTTLISF